MRKPNARKSSTSKRPVLVISAIILILLAGAALFLFMYRDKIPLLNTFNTSSSSSPQTETPATPAEKPNEQPVDKQYLVLEDWGVKFSIPPGLMNVEINYYKYRDGDNTETYGFTTQRVQALGGRCEERPYGGIYHLVRSVEKPEAVPHGAFASQIPINGYYYSYYSGPAGCSSLNKDGQFIGEQSQIEIEDRKHLQELLGSIVSK